MSRINYEKLRSYAREGLAALDQTIRDSILREQNARRQAIEDKRIKKLKKRKRKMRLLAQRDN